MPDHLTRAGRAARIGVLLTVALAPSCIEVHDASDEAAKKARDSISGAVYIGDAKPNATTPSPDAYGPDSATPVRGFGPTEIEALRTDSAHSFEVVDSTVVPNATSTDLDVLQREMRLPLPGITKNALRDTYNEMRGGTRTHEALDILAPRGTPVLSATSGRVLKLFNSKAGGLMVYAADSSERFILMYAHLDAYEPGLAEGQSLRRGQQIGTVGTTGNSPATVPHLHFAIARSSDVKQWWKGVPVNPYPLLK